MTRRVLEDDDSDEASSDGEGPVEGHQLSLPPMTPPPRQRLPAPVVIVDGEEDDGTRPSRMAGTREVPILIDDDDDDDAASGLGYRAPQMATPVRGCPRLRTALQAAVPALLARFNGKVFDGGLPAALPVYWSASLRTTAGVTRCSRLSSGERAATVTLSSKVVDSTARLESTLLHELCHVAAWLLDGVCKPPHGAAFKRWAQLAESRLPSCTVTTRHDYKIHFRHRLACTGCGMEFGRHSKPTDVARLACGRCGEAVEYRGAVRPDGTPVRATPANAFAKFVKANFGTMRKQLGPGANHADVMAAIAADWRAGKNANGGDSSPCPPARQPQLLDLSMGVDETISMLERCFVGSAREESRSPRPAPGEGGGVEALPH